MSSRYLQAPSQAPGAWAVRPRARLLACSLLFLFLTVTALASWTLPTSSPARADDFDIGKYLACKYPNSPVSKIYVYTQSDELYFKLRSKSSVAFSTDSVETGPGYLNNLLSYSRTGKLDSYLKVNEAILGRPVGTVSRGKPPTEGTFNGGAYVNPFDRFGVAGLNYTLYLGEWKYVVVDMCASGENEDNVIDSNPGAFYKDRKVPQSGWADIGNSKDVRTQQFDRFPPVDRAALNSFANMIFGVTKALVVLTIALINVAFSDVVKILGLNAFLGGDGTSQNKGLFGLLFTNLFQGLMWLAVIVTAANMFITGALRGRVREAFGMLARTVALFLVALFIALQPAKALALPNTVAVTLQALMASAMNTTLAGGTGLCATAVGEKATELAPGDPSRAGFLQKASDNMRSAISCTLWQQFLLKPWSQGQFGSDWTQLWAQGKMPSNGPRDYGTGKQVYGELANGKQNAAMVGDAAVPLGGKKVVNNWALFQISAQTDAHAFQGETKPSYGKYTAGVANDWWRIVDALANYEEEEVTKAAAGQEQQYGLPLEHGPTPQWNTWVGNSPATRFASALSSVLVGGLGIIAPLIFSLLTAVYAVGLTILLMFTPVMLLLGCAQPQGWEIFKGWGQLVINTFIKRVVAGALMMVSLILTAAVIDYMEKVNWFVGVCLLAALSIALVRNKKRIVDIFAVARFASLDMAPKLQKATGAASGTLRTGARMTTNSAISAVAAKSQGGTFTQGAGMGFKQELQQLSYRSTVIRSGFNTYRSYKNMAGEDDELSTLVCDECSGNINESNQYYSSPDGRVYCKQCGQDRRDMGDEELEIYDIAPQEEEEEKKSKQALHFVNDPWNDRRHMKRLQTESLRRFGKPQESTPRKRWRRGLEEADEQVEVKPLSQDDIFHAIVAQTAAGQELVKEYDKLSRKPGETIVKLPEELTRYVDQDIIEAALAQGHHEYLLHILAAGWVLWVEKELGLEVQDLSDGASPGEEEAAPSEAPNREELIAHIVEKAKEEIQRKE